MNYILTNRNTRSSLKIFLAVTGFLLFVIGGTLQAGELADAFNFESMSKWDGLTLDYNGPKEGRACGRWDDTVNNDRLNLKSFPQDITGFESLVLWVHSEKATGAIIAFVLFSENSTTEEDDYYMYNYTIDWEGWKVITIPFADMKVVRQPVGLHKVDSLRVASTGYGCGDAHPQTRLKFDAMRLMDLDEGGNPVAPILPVDWRKFDGVAFNSNLNKMGHALLYVRSSNFPLCEEFEKTYLLSEDMQRVLQGRTVFFVDVNENPIIAKQLKIHKVPCFILARANRYNEVLNITDLTDPKPILDFLSALPSVPLVPPYLR